MQLAITIKPLPSVWFWRYIHSFYQIIDIYIILGRQLWWVLYRRKCIFGLWHLSVWKPTYNRYGYLPLQYHDGCCCASAALPAKLFRNVNHWPVVHKVTAANIWLLPSTNVYFLYCATVLACPAEVSCFTMNSSTFKITKYYCNNCVFTKSGTILIKKNEWVRKAVCLLSYLLYCGWHNIPNHLDTHFPSATSTSSVVRVTYLSSGEKEERDTPPKNRHWSGSHR